MVQNEMLNYKKIEGGFKVKLPFDLKDSFRQTFKSAKWDTQEKVWKVGPRSEKRLKLWMSEVEETAKAILINDELELTEKELNNINFHNERIIEKFKSVKKMKNLLNESIALVEKAGIDLAKTEQALINEKEEKEKARDEAYNNLKKIINLDLVMSCKREMYRSQHHSNAARSENKRVFEENQGMIEHELKKLHKVGLDSLALLEITIANFNRPDRDNVERITMNDILILCKYTEGWQ